jgi:chorismate synthase
VAFKPPATIALQQKTVTSSKQQSDLAARGRHDPCVLPRAVPIVEAMAALVLCDHALRQNAISCGIPKLSHTKSTKDTKG